MVKRALSLLTAFVLCLNPLVIEAKTAKPKPIATPVKDITDPKSVQSPVNPNAYAVPLEDLSAIRSASEGAWLPDGRSLIMPMNLTGRTNIWKLSEGVMMPVQLTQSEDRQYGVSLSPDGKIVYFYADKDGQEVYDLYSVSADGGQVTNITHTDDVSEYFASPSPDGQVLVADVRGANDAIVNIGLVDVKTGKITNLTNETDTAYQWTNSGFSADGQAILATRLTSDYATGTAYLIDVKTGVKTRIIESKPEDMVWLSSISPDGQWLAFNSNMTTGQMRAGLYNLNTKQIRWLKPTQWEQSARQFSRDGKYLAIANNADGRGSISLVDLQTFAETPLRIDPGFVDLASTLQNSFNPVTGRLLVNRDGADSPMDYWTVDPTGKTPAERITRLSIASLDPANLPKSTIVHYKSFDGTLISGILTLPFNLKRDASAPAVILPHGGPTSQSQDFFSKMATALASRGYLVFQPNYRGSTGYGQEFQMANVKDFGQGDLKDVIAGVDFLEATGFVDPKRIGITGGSYGGYMTLMALSKYPDRFAVGVELYGIINWNTMFENEKGGLHEYLVMMIGDPVKDKALYEALSPMTYIQNLKAPLLVLQGDNDARVPRNQAEEIVSRIKANNGVVEAVFYPGEGHGFSRKENQIDALKRTVAWLDTYLRPNAGDKVIVSTPAK